MKVHLKMKALECLQHYSNNKSLEVFQTYKGSLDSKDPCLILLNLKPIQAFIAGLVICKNEKDPIKNENARVLTNTQGQLTQ